MAIKLERVDKNGTKHYVNNSCPKCGGTGNIPAYGYVEGGRCFKCGGSGEYITRFSEYTEEYAKKLEERRKKRAEKKRLEILEKADARNESFLAKNGFTSEGKTNVFLGNTFEIKEILKEEGAKFSYTLGWHSHKQIKDYPFIIVDVKDICEKNLNGDYVFKDEAYQIIENLKQEEEMKLNPSQSDYVGTIGEKIQMELTFQSQYSFQVSFGYSVQTSHIYKFVDAENNIIIWKTSKYLNYDSTPIEGDKFIIKGTIKEHSIYDNEKQTVLTRCKIV